MKKALYLINPRPDFSSMYNFDIFRDYGLMPAVQSTNLSTTTVAAFAPEDFEVKICEESIDDVDYDTDATYIGITGNGGQYYNMIRIADEFRRRKKTVILGGPFASMNPNKVRNHCDILIKGELESIHEEFYADLANGTSKEEYNADHPTELINPIPRFDLYPTDRSLGASVQTSRSCPFQCEFCDVTPFLGLKQRFKPIERVIAELENAAHYSFTTINLADDNITANRRHATELFKALYDWNVVKNKNKHIFSTQISVDCGDDPALLELIAQAGVQMAFIGLESPNSESLKSASKTQNIHGDVYQRVEHFVTKGIGLYSGMMVGFDSDTADIFKRQYEFAMSLPIPIWVLRALVAPYQTRLFTRLQNEGRIQLNGFEFCEHIGETNIVTKLMTKEELKIGVEWLINRLFAPKAFEERLWAFIKTIMQSPFGKEQYKGQTSISKMRSVEVDSSRFIFEFFPKIGENEAKILGRLQKEIFASTTVSYRIKGIVAGYLMSYMLHRHFYSKIGIWGKDHTI
jgi:radical SAM superfamily enzyme YgiQ (UPF0313 family)